MSPCSLLNGFLFQAACFPSSSVLHTMWHPADNSFPIPGAPSPHPSRPSPSRPGCLLQSPTLDSTPDCGQHCPAPLGKPSPSLRPATQEICGGIHSTVFLVISVFHDFLYHASYMVISVNVADCLNANNLHWDSSWQNQEQGVLEPTCSGSRDQMVKSSGICKLVVKYSHY